jgi:hypothetical protein
MFVSLDLSLRIGDIINPVDCVDNLSSAQYGAPNANLLQREGMTDADGDKPSNR